MTHNCGRSELAAGRYQINILGTRGIPGKHGGFETFATRFCEFLVQNQFSVVVYCQEEGGVSRAKSWTDEWNGAKRVHFETRSKGALATIEFDLRSTLHVLKEPGIDLVLGYNTAIFCLLQRLSGRQIAINMDGIEWKRRKWGPIAKRWLKLNEWIAGTFATLKISDHPQIAAHLAERGLGSSAVIPYGADEITDASVSALSQFDVTANNYFVSICRIEPENSILELVQAFVSANTDLRLVVLGNLQTGDPYHDQVRAAANDYVVFPGAIYDCETLRALRLYCRAYVHGHQVGGTNPSLVEALGAGNAIIAHDNPFNRWVAGDKQSFYSDVSSCAEAFRRIATGELNIEERKLAARQRHKEAFTFDRIHNCYLDELTKMYRRDNAVQPDLGDPRHRYSVDGGR
jgi:glycosyltransferase involved in cell wall biosynthesis